MKYHFQKILCGCVLGVLMCSLSFAQEKKEELTEEEKEILKNWEILEFFEYMDEDLSFLENFESIKDLDESGGQDEK